MCYLTSLLKSRFKVLPKHYLEKIIDGMLPVILLYFRICTGSGLLCSSFVDECAILNVYMASLKFSSSIRIVKFPVYMYMVYAVCKNVEFSFSFCNVACLN